MKTAVDMKAIHEAQAIETKEIAETQNLNNTRSALGKICVALGFSDPTIDITGTGDVDYAMALAQELDKVFPQGAVCLRGAYTEEAIYKQAFEQGPHPVLHIMVNPPGTGSAFTTEGLRGFKEAGGRVVATVIEFKRFQGRKNQLECEQQIWNVLTEAEEAIFVDELDKQAAITAYQNYNRYYNRKQHLSRALKTRLENAAVISVLPTVQPVPLPFEEHGHDVISFGMIRPGKGLGLVVELAKQLKDLGDAAEDKKVLVVGRLLPNHGSNKELARLLSAVYPDKSKEIYEVLGQWTADSIEAGAKGHALKQLLTQYQTEPNLLSNLPLEIHVDVPEDQLPELFNRSRYAFFPAYRGATLRNSSIINAMAQGWITYSHIEETTPDCLRPNGQYEHAVVLAPQELLEQGRGAEYVQNVLKDILARDAKPDLNPRNQHAMTDLMTNVLSRPAVIQAHRQFYRERLEPLAEPSFVPLAKDEIAKARPIIHHWKGFVQMARANRQLDNVHGLRALVKAGSPEPDKSIRNADLLVQLSTKNYQALQAKLGDLSKSEAQFYDTLMKGDWWLTHSTSSYSAIVDNGNALLSLKERRRRGIPTDNRNTSWMEGNDDNVFLVFGPGKVSSPDFLKDASHVFKINFDTALAHDGYLKGLWYSSHIYAYLREQKAEPIVVYGSQIDVRYQKIDPNGPVSTKNIEKIYRVKFPDGEVHEHRRVFAEEIFNLEHMKSGVALMALEQIRWLAPESQKEIFDNEELGHCQKLVQDIMHPGLYEAHKPASMDLSFPFVAVEERKIEAQKAQKDMQKEMQEQKEILKLLLEKISDKEANPVDSLAQTLNQKTQKNDKKLPGSLLADLLGEVIKHRSRIVFDWLQENSLLHFEEPEHYDKIRVLTSLFDYYDNDQQDSECFLQKLTEEGLRMPLNTGFSIFSVESYRHLETYFSRKSSLIDGMDKVLKKLNPVDMKLIGRILIFLCEKQMWDKAIWLMEQGADLNVNDTQYRYSKGYYAGQTLLATLIAVDNLELFDRFLQEPKVDINGQCRSEIGRLWNSALPQWEGFTPLMVAVALKKTSFIQILLQDPRVDLTVRSATGITVVDIAAQTGDNDVVELINAHIESNRILIPEKTPFETAMAAQKKADGMEYRFVLHGKNKDGARKILTYKINPQDPLSQFARSARGNLSSDLKELFRFFAPSFIENIPQLIPQKLCECGDSAGHQLGDKFWPYGLCAVHVPSDVIDLLELEETDTYFTENLASAIKHVSNHNVKTLLKSLDLDAGTIESRGKDAFLKLMHDVRYEKLALETSIKHDDDAALALFIKQNPDVDIMWKQTFDPVDSTEDCIGLLMLNKNSFKCIRYVIENRLMSNYFVENNFSKLIEKTIEMDDHALFISLIKNPDYQKFLDKLDFSQFCAKDQSIIKRLGSFLKDQAALLVNCCGWTMAAILKNAIKEKDVDFVRQLVNMDQASKMLNFPMLLMGTLSWLAERKSERIDDIKQDMLFYIRLNKLNSIGLYEYDALSYSDLFHWCKQDQKFAGSLMEELVRVLTEYNLKNFIGRLHKAANEAQCLQDVPVSELITYAKELCKERGYDYDAELVTRKASRYGRF